MDEIRKCPFKKITTVSSLTSEGLLTKKGDNVRIINEDFGYCDKDACMAYNYKEVHPCMKLKKKEKV